VEGVRKNKSAFILVNKSDPMLKKTNQMDLVKTKCKQKNADLPTLTDFPCDSRIQALSHGNIFKSHGFTILKF
jgi:hypothetical protein